MPTEKRSSNTLILFLQCLQEFLLWRGKEFFLRANEQLLAHLPGYKECLSATNLQEWLEHSYAMAGFDSPDHYYECNNPVNFVYNTKKPVMFINSEDGKIFVKFALVWSSS